MSDIFSFMGSEPDKTEPKEEAAAARSRSEEEAARIEKEEKKKAQDKYLAMQGYAEFRQSLAGARANEKKRASMQSELDSSGKSRAKYEEMWTNASNKAQSAWSKKNNKLAEQAEAECAAYRRQAEANKTARDREAEKNEREVKARLNKTESARQEILKNREICQNNLKKVSNRTGKLSCDASIKAFMADAAQKDLLSETQKNMCSMPVGQFCQTWTPTPGALQQMEKKFAGTAFYRDAQNFQGTGKALSKLKMKWQLIVTAVFLLLALLDYRFDSGILSKADVPVILAWCMVIGYVVLAVPASILSKKNNGRLWGLVGMIAGVITFFTMSSPGFGSNLVFVILWTVMAGFLPRILITLFQAWIRNSSGVMQEEYKDFFKGAEDYERENNPQLKLKQGEMDAMVACYIRHDELSEFLVRADSEQKAAEFNQHLQEMDIHLKKCDEIKQQCNSRLQEINELQRQNKQKDREDEAWLERQTAEVYRKYGISGMPDFKQRSNLLTEDIHYLTEAEKLLHIPSSSTGTKFAALLALDKRNGEIKNEIRKAEQENKAYIRKMKEWYRSKLLPPLEQKVMSGNNAARTVYYHSVGDTLCLCTQAAEQDPQKDPLLIMHNGGPIMVPQSADTMDAVHLTDIIREFWKAWTKNSPAELMRLGLLDPSGKVSMHYKGWTSQTRLEFTEYAVADTVPGQNNEISCLFDPRRIQEFDDAFGRQIQECQEYFSRNMESIRKISGEESNFEKMNRFRMHDSSRPEPVPYFVTLIIVPEEMEAGAFVQGPHECMKNMSNIIENEMCREYGFIPILIYTEGHVPKNWSRMVEIAKEKSTAVRL